jgi:hypothetical protein
MAATMQSNSRQSNDLCNPLAMLANMPADPLIANQPAPPWGGRAARGAGTRPGGRFSRAPSIRVPLPVCSSANGGVARPIIIQASGGRV